MKQCQQHVKRGANQWPPKKLINFFKPLKALTFFRKSLLQDLKEVPSLGGNTIKIFKLMASAALILSFIGCSSIEKTSLLGLTVGGGIGAIADQGLNENTNKDSMIKNSIIGAVVGLGVGYLLHTVIDNREDKVRKETLFNLEAYGIDQDFKPVIDSEYGNFVTSPYVKEDYIDTHTTDDGRVLIQGHKRWVLIGSPQFNLPAPVKDKN